MKHTPLFALTLLTAVSLTSCRHHDGQTAAVDALPATAQTFVQTHFSDKQVAAVRHDRDILDGDYEVIFTDGASIDFTRSGAWEEVKDRDADGVPAAIIPQPILDHVAANHAGQHVVQISREATGYDVELSSTLELEFDANGVFLRYDN
ncbi:MAG: Protein of unknown function (DUF2874) [bacterium P3]|nr:MAG: Protein of unknown function (DUF2874) [bacterium P201]KWW30446.1 MAG: Protein of unknown function (DUF2874) [bacterium P3]KWW41333.1 MAG: Protein of unknown function (DUF2874) [bacterium F083]